MIFSPKIEKKRRLTHDDDTRICPPRHAGGGMAAEPEKAQPRAGRYALAQDGKDQCRHSHRPVGLGAGYDRGD